MSQTSASALDEVRLVGERPATDAGARRQVSLVDLLDRLLGTGIVLSGDVVISLAGVDLVQVRLHALISSVREEMRVPATGSAWLAAAETTQGSEED